MEEIDPSGAPLSEDGSEEARPGSLEVFQGTFVHATESRPMVVLQDTLVGVLRSKIEFVASVDELSLLKSRYGFDESSIQKLTPDQFMMPGLVDTHIHAAQFPNNGLALDLPLLDWLQRYTYPTEAQFADQAFARDVYGKVVARLLKNGTTTACYYATAHLDATRILADAVHARGQRALIGKVNMTRNCPQWYKEASVAESIRDTEQLIRYVRAKRSGLIAPVITPRFAVACSEEHLLQLSHLATKHSCHIQTHLSENRAEVRQVQQLFPSSESYTHVYDSAKLLGHKTVLAHCIWLTEAEIDLLAERGCGVSHCPNSNLSLRSGICDVRKLLDRGINVGLGTDCSAGYAHSVLDSLRHAVQSSNVLSLERDSNYRRINVGTAFMMATLGGAKALNMGDQIGSFEVGKDFDALLIDVAAPGTPLDTFNTNSIEDKMHKFLFLGDDRNIRRVYVAGRVVSSGPDRTPVDASSQVLVST